MPAPPRPWTRSLTLALALLPLLGGCLHREDPLVKAREAIEQHDSASAVVQLKALLQREPKSPEGRLLLGTVLLDRGEAAAAAIELEKARALGAPAERTAPALARALWASGRTLEVLPLLSSLGDLNDPTAMADLLTTKAMVLFAQKDEAGGRQALERARERDAGFVPARLLVARRLADARDLTGALELVDETLQQSPEAGAARLLRAELLVAQGKTSPAENVVEFRRALAAGADVLQGHAGATMQLLRDKDLAGASAQVDALRKLRPEHPQTVYLEALVALRKGELAAARARAEKLVALAPAVPSFRRLAGEVASQSGDDARAAGHLAAALQAQPGDMGLRRRLALAQVRSGQPQAALATLQPLAGGAARDAEALTLEGLAELQLGHATRGQRLLADAARLEPRSTAVRTTLALGRLGSGTADSEAALSDLERLTVQDHGTTVDRALVSALMQRREFAAALRAIDRMEQKNPKAAAPELLRSEVLLRSGDLPSARAALERLLARQPDHLPALGALAQLDLREGRPEVARQRFEKLLREQPRRAEAMVALAGLLELQGSPPAESAKLLENAIRIDPTRSGPRLLLIDHEIRHRRGPAALTAAEDAVQALPSEPRMQQALGRAAVAAGDLRRARQVFGALAMQPPLRADPLRDLAHVEMALHDVDGARTALRRAMDADPASVAVLQDLVRLEIDAGRADEARSYARRVQVLQPAQSLGFALEADVAARAKNWAEAERLYEAALGRAGDTGRVAQSLHALLLAAGKGPAASGLAERWQRQHPGDADFLRYLGDEATLRQDLQAAAGHYAAALQIRPDMPGVLNNLAWITGRLGRPGAVTLAERACALRPDDPAYLDTLAQLLAAGKEHDRAIAAQKRALLLAPDDPALRLNLARLLVESGDRAAARVELSALAALGSRFPHQADVEALRRRL